MPRKSPGGPRAATLTVRLPEKTRFGVDLMARLYREPVPDIVIRALNYSFLSEHDGLFVDLPGEEMPVSLMSLTWADRESDRFANLALRYPSIMTGAEQRMWSQVKAEPKYWTVLATSGKGKRERNEAPRNEKSLLRDMLAEDWDKLKAVSIGLD